MRNIKMIALDLDGTTLRDDKTLSCVTVRTLEKAGKRGVSVVIATGRTFDALPDSVFDLSCVTHFICSNGAAIYDAKTKNLIYEKNLDAEAVTEMTELVKERGYMFESFTAGKAYIGRDYYDAIKNRELDYRGRDYVLKTRTPVDDIYEFTLSHKEHIENLNVFFPTQEEKAEFRPLLERIPNSTLTSSFISNYELGGSDVNKGNALKYVMDLMGIHSSELLAAGDSPNDIRMLELAGISVAVENAEREVKEAADHITSSNDEDGVAHAIEDFVL